LFRFAHARHRAAFALLVFGSVALIGAQQVLGTVADAQTTEAVDVAHNMQPIGAAQPGTRVSTVNSAVVTGQFEDLVRPTQTSVSTAAPTVPAKPQPTATPAPKLFETGIASTYGEGDGFEGNRTACGQIFHTSVVQIAHKSLPCGTHVRVVDTSTGKVVDARVTDRGPYIAGRIVDLSWGAFEQLDPTGPGLLHVDVYLVTD
jgi:peptidoglycan lytic transglycosylase